MEHGSYRPAALRGEIRVAWDDKTFQQGQGPVRPWAALTDVALQVQVVRGVEFVTLTLTFGADKEEMSWSGVGPQINDFYDLVQSVLQALSVQHPDMTVTLGPTGGYRIAGQITWALLALVGLFLIGVAVLLVSEGDWTEAVVMGPVGLLVTFWGGSMFLDNRPGKPPKKVPLAGLIATLGGSEDTP